jgi:hypothetical protein
LAIRNCQAGHQWSSGGRAEGVRVHRGCTLRRPVGQTATWNGPLPQILACPSSRVAGDALSAILAITRVASADRQKGLHIPAGFADYRIVANGRGPGRQLRQVGSRTGGCDRRGGELSLDKSVRSLESACQGGQPAGMFSRKLLSIKDFRHSFHAFQKCGRAALFLRPFRLGVRTIVCLPFSASTLDAGCNGGTSRRD